MRPWPIIPLAGLLLAAGCSGPSMVDYRERLWADVESPLPVVPRQHLPHDLAVLTPDHEDVKAFMKKNPDLAHDIRNRPRILDLYNEIWEDVRGAMETRYPIRYSEFDKGILKSDIMWIGGTGGVWRFAVAKVLRVSEFRYECRVFVFQADSSDAPEAVLDPELTAELRDEVERRHDLR
ncbi:MAG: hypothetical protein AAB215_02465 [Planctomycetota bacterium]